MSDKTQASVALEDLDRRIVGRVAKEYGLNFSSALRMIIRDYEKSRKAVRTAQTQPTQQPQEQQG